MGKRKKKRKKSSGFDLKWPAKKRRNDTWHWPCVLATVFFIVLLVGLMAIRVTQSNSSTAAIESPPPNTLIAGFNIREVFYPETIKSLIINPDSQTNYFDFVVDTGNNRLWYEDELKPKARNLINYFYLGITLPPDDFWVNLNPTEPDRITSPNLGWTDIGKILLEADFKLKKDSCHFTDPREDLGKRYWDALNKRLQEEGFPNVQITTSNRLWIIPEEAIVEEDEQKFTIVSSKLRVCLESEYLSRQNNTPSLFSRQNKTSQKIQDIASEVMHEVVLPILEDEVNYGRAYAPLRQVYDSLILAEVYKQKYWGNGKFFSHCINRSLVNGLESEKTWSKHGIFSAYVQSYKNGEYSFYQTEYAPFQFGVMTQKHYFSGGVDFSGLRNTIILRKKNDVAQTQSQTSDVLSSSPVTSNGKLVLVKASNHQDPQSPWKLQEIKLTDLPHHPEASIVLAKHEEDRSSQSSDINLAGSKETTKKVPHESVNDYIRENLPRDLLENPANIVNYALAQGYEIEARVIPIQGLFSRTGQFGHIGLGRIYGQPVIYVDAMLFGQDKQDVLNHELFEIAKWEDVRKGLGKQPHQMRQWIQNNYEFAKERDEAFHLLAPSIGHLFAKYKSQIDEGSVETLLAMYEGERDVNLASQEDETELPYYWEKSWMRPTDEETARAEKIHQEITSRMQALGDREEYDFLAGDFFWRSDLSGKTIAEKVNTLRALYLKDPELTPALLLSMSDESKGYMESNEARSIEADMLGQMVRDGLSSFVYLRRGYARYEEEQRQPKVKYEFSGITTLLGSLDPVSTSNILKMVMDDNLHIIIEQIGNYLRIQGPSGTIGLNFQEVLRRIPLARMQRIQEKLSEEAESYLIAEGFLSSRTSIAEQHIAQGKLPPHWDKNWELPTNAELRRAEDVLEYMSVDEEDEEYRRAPELQSFPFWDHAGESYSQRARTLRAIYYLSPDVAGACMISFGFGMHGTWRDLVDYHIETPVLAAIVNRGLSIYDADEYELDYKGKRISISRTIDGLTGLIGYMRSEASLGILERLKDEQLYLLVDSMAGYVLHQRGVYPGVRERIFELLKKIPSEKIKLIKGKLSAEIRNFLVSIDKLSLPEVPPLPLVEEVMPRVLGKGIGKLVVLRDEIPDFNTLKDLPENTIVAMSFLPTSDTRVGPFRGILTFRQEGETSHAQARSRIWKVPHALWPGAESLAELDGKDVVFEVTEKQVNIREATEKDLEISQPEVVAVQIQFPSARLDGEEYYLGPGNSKLADPEEVGYKVALLNQLASRLPKASDSKIQVSLTTGAALPFRTFTHMLETGEQTHRFKGLLRDLRGDDEWRIGHTLRDIRDVFDDIEGRRAGFASEELWRQFVMEGEGGEFWRNGVFVRTSTNVENLPAHPGVGAGVYKTESNVIGQYAFWDALKAVWASVWSEQAFWERRKLGIDETQVFPAVWLFPSIPAKYSFVIHTSSISTKQPNQVVIEVVQGLGESLVGDDPMFAGFPTHIVWDKKSQRIVLQTPSTKQRQSILAEAGGTLVEDTNPEDEFLSHPDARRLIKALVEVGQQTEAFFGQAQEIEGALTYNEESKQWTVNLLQTRFVNAPDVSGSSTSPGAQFGGDLALMDELLFRAKVFYRLKNGRDAAETAMPKEMVEYFLSHIRSPGVEGGVKELDDVQIKEVLEELPAEDRPQGKIQVLLIDLPQDKHATRFKEKVIDQEGGVKAINFRNPDGSWTILIQREDFESYKYSQGLPTLKHELREIALRQQGLHWIDAHNQAVEELEIGGKIDEKTARQYKAAEQNQIGAAVGIQRWWNRLRDRVSEIFTRDGKEESTDKPGGIDLRRIQPRRKNGADSSAKNLGVSGGSVTPESASSPFQATDLGGIDLSEKKIKIIEK